MTKHDDVSPVATEASPNATVPIAQQGRQGTRGGPVAVVELFTSEGCSSCPPADELLSDLVHEAQDRGLPVFALGFHVDYWDFQGWPDRFATSDNTARQSQYGGRLGTSSLYTPQMLVNGVVEFIGSHRSQAWKEITAALAQPSATSVRLTVDRPADGPDALRVSFEVDTAPDGAVVNVAVVESGISVEVRAGENAGRTLRHDNAVRTFTTAPLTDDQGEVEIGLPPDIDTTTSSVVVYVQVCSTGRIVAAAAEVVPACASG
jgi:hypothetical protein